MSETQNKSSSQLQNSSISEKDQEVELKDANKIVGLGLGVGALGVCGGLIAGAVCPICYIATPALIGAGLIKRRQVNKPKSKDKKPPSEM